jgi:eukaryotic-like serine/threonine-protein kinase
MNQTEHDSRILAFEQTWQRGSVPEIRDFLPVHFDPSARRELLLELICIDLEYRWRASQEDATHPKPLMDYANSFPDLGYAADLPLELIGEDYRVRQRWGDRPGYESIIRTFPHREPELRKLLEQIDKELLAETIEEPNLQTAKSVDYDARTDPAAPLAYSDYKLQKLIGAGLMGRVYLAWQKSLDRPVAVKYLRKSFHHDPGAVVRFLSEARTVAKLRHPHIVGIHGLGRTPQGGYFIVMDWIDGCDLAEVIHRRGTVEVPEALRWMREACAALERAHALGIIHCDLKPGNLLLDVDGHIHITDFGLSRSLADESRTNDRIEGTAPFMAPEQVSSHWGKIDARTDVYGLGAVLYTLLTGVPPSQGRTLADVLANVISAHPIPPAGELRPNLPPTLTRLCTRCLAKSPAERFAHLNELSIHLNQVQQDLA